jgi:hypothetical protein
MTVEIAAGDQAIDHELAQLSQSFRFLLDITPVDADERKADFLAGADPAPDFTYRDLEPDPEVARAMLADIDIDNDVAAVEDPTLGHLLRAKRREILREQLERQRAGETAAHRRPLQRRHRLGHLGRTSSGRGGEAHGDERSRSRRDPPARELGQGAPTPGRVSPARRRGS